ncbi:hypothetical protein [Streptomyces uncialis]|uniref:hypothetical protein n=1 Tax=Streptomyces uncialis TaxID=1048205 RepID=UPI0037A255DA
MVAVFSGMGGSSCSGRPTEIGHRLGSGFVQRADLVVRAPAAGVPVLLLEIDRRTEDAHDLVVKLRRYWEWGRLLPPDADKRTVDLVRSRPAGGPDMTERCTWPNWVRPMSLWFAAGPSS